MICRISSIAAAGLLYPMHAAFITPRPCSALTLPRCCSAVQGSVEEGCRQGVSGGAAGEACRQGECCGLEVPTQG